MWFEEKPESGPYESVRIIVIRNVAEMDSAG